MTGLLTLYERATRVGTPFLELLLKYRTGTGKEDPARLHERRGNPQRARPAGRLVWVHAASVGEAQSAMILIDAIGKISKDIHVLVTTGTMTSAQLMQSRLPDFAFHQYVPLDHPDWVARFLNYWKPDLALWMESELWPNMLHALKTANIPAALVNARLSDSSFRNWMMAKGLAKSLLDSFSMIIAQTDKDAGHFKTLGADNVIVGGNIKYSADPLPHDELALAALRLSISDRPVWVYASTHEGEEDLACRVHKEMKETLPDLLTIIVPRHPARREDIANVCFENGLSFRLRSDNVALPAPDDDIYIADTMGELGLFYTLCPVAMIGRSFSDDGGGGHNPVEAAQLGCAVVTGPNNQFQRQLYDDMRAADAVIEVQDEDALRDTLLKLLSDAPLLEDIQRKTALFALQRDHVIDGVLEKLLPMIPGAGKYHAA